jgi:hypothetical protein
VQPTEAQPSVGAVGRQRVESCSSSRRPGQDLGEIGTAVEPPQHSRERSAAPQNSRIGSRTGRRIGGRVDCGVAPDRFTRSSGMRATGTRSGFTA